MSIREDLGEISRHRVFVIPGVVNVHLIYLSSAYSVHGMRDFCDQRDALPRVSNSLIIRAANCKLTFSAFQKRDFIMLTSDDLKVQIPRSSH